MERKVPRGGPGPTGHVKPGAGEVGWNMQYEGAELPHDAERTVPWVTHLMRVGNRVIKRYCTATVMGTRIPELAAPIDVDVGCCQWRVDFALSCDSCTNCGEWTVRWVAGAPYLYYCASGDPASTLVKNGCSATAYGPKHTCPVPATPDADLTPPAVVEGEAEACCPSAQYYADFLFACGACVGGAYPNKAMACDAVGVIFGGFVEPGEYLTTSPTIVIRRYGPVVPADQVKCGPVWGDPIACPPGAPPPDDCWVDCGHSAPAGCLDLTPPAVPELAEYPCPVKYCVDYKTWDAWGPVPPTTCEGCLASIDTRVGGVPGTACAQSNDGAPPPTGEQIIPDGDYCDGGFPLLRCTKIRKTSGVTGPDCP
jgi:hypothetical protein